MAVLCYFINAWYLFYKLCVCRYGLRKLNSSGTLHFIKHHSSGNTKLVKQHFVLTFALDNLKFEFISPLIFIALIFFVLHGTYGQVLLLILFQSKLITYIQVLFRDLDGSLSGVVGGWVTPNSGLHPSHSCTKSVPEFSVNINFPGTVCESDVYLLRLSWNRVEPFVSR